MDGNNNNYYYYNDNNDGVYNKELAQRDQITAGLVGRRGAGTGTN